jgi:hypothetical protein
VATTNSQSPADPEGEAAARQEIAARAAEQKLRRQKALEVGRAVHFHNPEAEAAARKELAVLQIEQYIERALARAPKLSDQQVKRLSAILRTGGHVATPAPAVTRVRKVGQR